MGICRAKRGYVRFFFNWTDHNILRVGSISLHLGRKVSGTFRLEAVWCSRWKCVFFVGYSTSMRSQIGRRFPVHYSVMCSSTCLGSKEVTRRKPKRRFHRPASDSSRRQMVRPTAPFSVQCYRCICAQIVSSFKLAREVRPHQILTPTNATRSCAPQGCSAARLSFRVVRLCSKECFLVRRTACS